MAKIRVLSLGYDGCLARDGFNYDIDTHNQDLIDALKLKKKEYAKTIAFVGSTRQSKYHDDHNAEKNGNGSCFDHIPLFCKAIDAKFDPFLLADAYNDAAPGTSLEQAKDPTLNKFKHNGWLYDASKISIIYAQMQKIASENPGKEIDFEFYDDRGEILVSLYQFFARHPHLIPAKVTLNLSLYCGDGLSAPLSLSGEGHFVNSYYAQVIKKFGDDVLVEMKKERHLLNKEGIAPHVSTIQNDKYNDCPGSLKAHHFQHLVNAHNSYSPELLDLKAKIAKAVHTYCAYTSENCRFSIFHRHGETGRKRAMRFLEKTKTITDLELLQTTIDEFLKDSKNGNTNLHSFRPILLHTLYEPISLKHGDTFSLNDAVELLSQGSLTAFSLN